MTRQRGFSLLELLLVLVVVALIVTVAGLSVSSGGRAYTLDGAARTFADIAEYAMDEAQLNGVDMGLLIEEDQRGGKLVYGFRWLQRGARGWDTPERDAEVFQRQWFPEEMELVLEVEEDTAQSDTQTVELDEQERDSDEITLRPQVVFYSSGETTPGILTLLERGSGDTLWELEWDLLGRFDLRRKGLEDDADEYDE